MSCKVALSLCWFVSLSYGQYMFCQRFALPLQVTLIINYNDFLWEFWSIWAARGELQVNADVTSWHIHGNLKFGYGCLITPTLSPKIICTLNFSECKLKAFLEMTTSLFVTWCLGLIHLSIAFLWLNWGKITQNFISYRGIDGFVYIRGWHIGGILPIPISLISLCISVTNPRKSYILHNIFVM